MKPAVVRKLREEALRVARDATKLQVAVLGETYRGETQTALDPVALGRRIAKRAQAIADVWEANSE